ncbi:hypothetical protein DPEC_G00098570 [Dallia pectoralis]|uniref:Uncharacterized protein n=1 Tax=Dallia pectoralis TaxID=75939 RepID=A0ACC2GWH4_DALPE|nr:hypothetical protein DPEC_G00098570 [Dallia pectoralis]
MDVDPSLRKSGAAVNERVRRKRRAISVEDRSAGAVKRDKSGGRGIIVWEVTNATCPRVCVCDPDVETIVF